MNQTFLEGGKDPRSQLSLVLNTVTVARDLKINWVKKKKMKPTSQFEVKYMIRCFSPLPQGTGQNVSAATPVERPTRGQRLPPGSAASTPLSESDA